METQTLLAGAQMGLPEALGPACRDATDIAREVALDASVVRRVLRAWAAMGLATGCEDGGYAATDLTVLLRRDAPDGLRRAAEFVGTVDYEAWRYFPEAVGADVSASSLAFGTDYWSHLGQRPTEVVDALAATMRSNDVRIGDWIVSTLRGLGDTRVLCDLGGAGGHLTARFLRDSPEASGIVVDLPHMRRSVLATIDREHLTGRVDFRDADVRTDPLPAADLFVIKHVLHNWDDAAVVRILGNVRKHMRPGAHLAIVETAHDAAGMDTKRACFMDLDMMVLHNSRERTVDEYLRLVEDAGLKVIPPMAYGPDRVFLLAASGER